jgi:hypothetical protein
MKRQLALSAIDTAFCDGIKLIYERLVSNMSEQSHEVANAEFTRGLDIRHTAYSKARALIEAFFPEGQ